MDMNQNKISKRQLTRMIYIEGFGASGLTFPAAAAFGSVSEGMLPMLCYGIFLVILTAYLLWAVGRYENSEGVKTYSGVGFIMNRWIGWIYVIRFFINGMALFCFFGYSIQKIYMPDAGLFKILLPFAFLLWYCAQTTLQKRARFLELLFPWIAGIFFVMLFFAFLGLQGDIRMLTCTDSFSTIAANGYLLLLCSSPLEFLFLLAPTVTDNLWNEQEEKDLLPSDFSSVTVWKAVAGVFCWNLLLWFFTVETIGGPLTAASPWPVIKMMQLIRLPGGFLERFDILLAVFWILCMIGILSGYLYYGRRIGESVTFGHKMSKKEKQMASWMIALAVIFMLGIACFLSPSYVFNKFVLYKKWIDFPLLVLLPLLAGGIGKWNRRDKKVIGILPFLLLCLVLCGCRKQADVEEKSYVLSLYVDCHEGKYEYQVAKADLAAMEEKEDSIPCVVSEYKGKSIKEMEEQYQKMEVGELEWNHIYTIFLGSGIVNNQEKLEEFLEEWEDSWQKSPGALLCVCLEDPEKLFDLKNLPEGAAGQEVSRLAEQEEQILCRTPIEVLKARGEGADNIYLYQVTVEDERMELSRKHLMFKNAADGQISEYESEKAETDNKAE